MPGTAIATLYNANVYVNGESFAGVAEEVTLPDLKPKMTDHHPLSGIGTIELPTGLDKMGMKIKWNSANPDVLMNSADFYNAQDIMIRANSDIWVNDSRTGSVPVTAFIRGRSTGVPPIGLKHQDNPDIETNYTIHAYKLEMDGAVLFEIDLYAQVYIVDGVDMYAAYRANLGL
jgi:hypothetical protein